MKKDKSLSLLPTKEQTIDKAPAAPAAPVKDAAEKQEKPALKKKEIKTFTPQYRIVCLRNSTGAKVETLFNYELDMPDKETAESVFKAFCFDEGVFYTSVKLQVKWTQKGKWRDVETYVLPHEIYVLRTFTGTVDDVFMISEDRFDNFDQALKAYNTELQGRNKNHNVSLIVYNYLEKKCEVLATERGFLPTKKPKKAAA